LTKAAHGQVVDICVVVPVPRNISAPQFIGPVYTDMDFYFICRVVYTDSVEVSFDVTLTFDGERLPEVAVKTVSSTSSLDAIFTPDDFTGQLGKMVLHFSTLLSFISFV